VVNLRNVLDELAPWLKEVLDIVFGGRETVRAQRPLSFLITPASPLTIEHDYTQTWLELRDYGLPVAFTGSASGGMAPYTYEWSSDVDGLLGMGPSINTVLSGSQLEGQVCAHTITLKVTDSFGMTAVDAIQVKIQPTALEEARLLPDDSQVWLLGQIATAVFGDDYYIEEEDRSSGICVGITPLPAVGDMMNVVGDMDTVNGERIIVNGTSVTASTGNTVPDPLYIMQKRLGGMSPGPNCPGITGAWGLFNVGLLMTISGSVTHSESEFFYVDDGSALEDGSGYMGVKVLSGDLDEPDEEEYAVVTGISGAEMLGGNVVRVMRPRVQEDIIPYSE
jgi:hypothetical protein